LAGNLRVEIRARKFRTSYERARALVRVVTCATRKHAYPRRMTTIGMETGIQQERHEYLSRLIYIFLLQIFADKMTRDRIETGRAPWKPHCERKREGERERESWEEKEGGKRALRGCWTLHAALSPWRRARFVEGNVYPAIVKRNFRRREKYVLLREAVSRKRYVNS